MDHVFLTCPVYDARLDFGTGMRLWHAASRSRQVTVCVNCRSLLASNCNRLWCSALNARQSLGLKWFAMLHADVEPDAFWLDALIDEADRHDADLLSAVIPIKDGRGLLSTAIDSQDQGFLQYCRLTLKQVHHPSFPATFGIAEAADALESLPEELRVRNVPRSALLVNTGCFVARIDRPWCEKVRFEIQDGIEFRGGEWREQVVSEDWMFSRHVAAQGGKVMATRLINVIHHGQAKYPSAGLWGGVRDPDSLDTRHPPV